MYRDDGLTGGHVIRLGPGQRRRGARGAGGLAGRTAAGRRRDARERRGLARRRRVARDRHELALSQGAFSPERLEAIERAIGRDRLVVDLSSRRVGDGWRVAIDRWQTITVTAIDQPTLRGIAAHCAEFLVHAADVEGLCEGIDEELVAALGRWSPVPCTYAGGGRELADLARVRDLSGGRVDLTFGSALDIFGGVGRPVPGLRGVEPA